LRCAKQSELARISRLAGGTSPRLPLVSTRWKTIFQPRPTSGRRNYPNAVGRITISFTSTLALFGGFGFRLGVGVRLEQVNHFDEIHPANFAQADHRIVLQYAD